MALGVLVVSYRRADLLDRCLASVRKNLDHLPDCSLLVWDNASPGSAEVRALAAGYPEARWTFADRNYGYAAAVNALARQLPPDTDLLLLNPDAELTGPLDRVRAALAGPRVAAVSPTVVDPTGATPRWDVARRRQTVLRALVSHTGQAGRWRGRPWSDRYAQPPTGPEGVDGYLSGCGLLISGHAWRELGGFDERFFVYGEEAEWQARARAHGWRLRLVDEPDVRHLDRGTVAHDVLAARRSADLLRAGHAELLGINGNRGPGTRFTAGLLIADRLQRSHRAQRREANRAAARRAMPGRPSVLLTTNQLCLGGAERQRVLLANELAARGYPVTVVCLQSFGPLASELDPAVRLVLSPWWQPLVDAPTRKAVLITGITNTEAGFAAGWRPAGSGTRRWLAAAHEPARPHSATYGTLLAWAIRRSDGAIALSERHWADLTRHQRLHRKYHVAANGVPPQRDRGFTAPNTPDRPLRLGMLSRIVRHKNPHLLVDALSSLSGLPWTLDIFGDGPDLGPLSALTPDTLRARVRWRGPSPGPDHAFNEIDVLCVPSGAEAFPLVIVEAMARGVPVAASAVGSVPELLDGGRAGVLVEPVSTRAWTEALRPMLVDPAPLASLARIAARRAATRYSVASMTDAYEHAIREALG
ncbi:MAG TPA: glycosyltransferase [Pseudonocardiaceae bacterium]|jgi:GT2 family glycosyltransferase/glycosyltransferase involved in cell wall biosynthesis|nr:glycosyltransferase [Pseudonocardiaceae bacterium]